LAGVENNFKPRPYQEKILEQTLELLKQGKNPIIELDCGMGKRLLTLWLSEKLKTKFRIILILNSSASLQETSRFMREHWKKQDEIGILSSRVSSNYREYLLKEKKLLISLPQTLANTIKKTGEFLPHDHNWLIIINEIDQIIRRVSGKTFLKQPYPIILSSSLDLRIIGMSGTLRDEHYVLDDEQLKIRKDLDSLRRVIPNSEILFMDEFLEDTKPFISHTIIRQVFIEDLWTQKVAKIIETEIQAVKQDAKEYGIPIGKGPFGLLPQDFYPRSEEEELLLNKLSRLYLIRKYLYAMPAKDVLRHLYSVIEKKKISDLWKDLPHYRHKTKSLELLLKESEFSVILCSYLSTVEEVKSFLSSKGWKIEVITGKTLKRDEKLKQIRSESGKHAVILSNVGERDIDIPEADSLVIYDSVNTVKTVYQKLKRSRGGNAFILTYSSTSEEDKVIRILQKIKERYKWSVIFEKEIYLDF